jgi:asparagine synthase (glutamine-hydrolysing)
MCGIVSIINISETKKIASHHIERMNAALNHRGPDGEGVWVSPCSRVHFGHKRLSIIDLSDTSAQPMHASDARYVLIFNGEIYNYKELKQECLKAGSQFNTLSDTEVIIEVYRHWGVSGFNRLRGMWAFILLDRRDNIVVISRDPFAIKPLYYGFLDGHFYCASEIKALTAVSDFFREEDTATTQLFLEYGYLDRDEWTFFKNIKRFPHAHYAIINLNQKKEQLDCVRYWTAPEIDYSLSFKRAVKQLKELFIDSIQLHLRSDVPIGSCLSGGIDSSAIVGVATSLQKNQAYTTFTAHYPNHPEYDESRWAKLVIDHCKTDSIFIEPTQAQFMDSLDDLLWTQDEPFGSMSIFAQYCVFKRIGESSVKVVLNGQGADEILAGYHGYVPIYFDHLLKKKKFLTLTKELLAFKDMNIQYNLKAKLLSYWNTQWRQKKATMHQQAYDTQINDQELHSRLNRLVRPSQSFEGELTHLLCESNIPQLLRYEDRNSMRFSIESRVPFLNSELVSFILSLPAEFKIKGGYTKAVFREALKDIMPREVYHRKDKLGFPAPEINWMKACFNIDVPSAGSKQWREFIYARWSGLQGGKCG